MCKQFVPVKYVNKKGNMKNISVKWSLNFEPLDDGFVLQNTNCELNCCVDEISFDSVNCFARLDDNICFQVGGSVRLDYLLVDFEYKTYQLVFK